MYICLYIYIYIHVTVYLYDPTDPGFTTRSGLVLGVNKMSLCRCRSGALTTATSSEGGKFSWKFTNGWVRQKLMIGCHCSFFLGGGIY